MVLTYFDKATISLRPDHHVCMTPSFCEGVKTFCINKTRPVLV